MLRVRGLAVRYGPIAAVKGVDLDVARGEIVALIGADGAGKTTFSGAAQDLAGNRLVTDSFLGGHVRDRDGRTSTEARAPS